MILNFYKRRTRRGQMRLDSYEKPSHLSQPGPKWMREAPHLNPLPKGEEDAKRQVRVSEVRLALVMR